MRELLERRKMADAARRADRGESSRRPRARARLVGAIVAGAVAALAFAPLSAMADGHSCSSGDVCVYNNANLLADPWNGTGVVNPWSAFSGGYANMYNWPSPHTYNNPDVCNNVYGFWKQCNLNDTISSARNRDGSFKVRLFNDANYSGGFQTINPGASVNQLTHNDQVTSLCWNAGTVCSF